MFIDGVILFGFSYWKLMTVFRNNHFYLFSVYFFGRKNEFEDSMISSELPLIGTWVWVYTILNFGRYDMTWICSYVMQT